MAVGECSRIDQRDRRECELLLSFQSQNLNKPMGDSLKSRLLEVILLLVGVSFFNYTVSLVGYIIPLDTEFGRILLEIYPWVGKVIFGLLLLPQVWKTSPKMAMAVSFLAA